MPTKTTTPKTPAKATPKAPKLALAQGVDGEDAADGAEGTAEKGANGLRLKWLVDEVVAATGVKKKGAKDVVEATLLLMGNALKAGEVLNLPGLGKMRVVRQGEDGGAMTLKLRQATPNAAKENADTDPIAEDADQD